MGSQAWVFICVSLSELILNIKFGLELFSQTQISKMIIWVILNVVISFLGVLISTWIYKWRYFRKLKIEKVESQDILVTGEDLTEEEDDEFEGEIKKKK